jgi:hypothetical protein
MKAEAPGLKALRLVNSPQPAGDKQKIAPRGGRNPDALPFLDRFLGPDRKTDQKQAETWYQSIFTSNTLHDIHLISYYNIDVSQGASFCMKRVKG